MGPRRQQAALPRSRPKFAWPSGKTRKQVLGAGHDAWTIGDWCTRGTEHGDFLEDLLDARDDDGQQGLAATSRLSGMASARQSDFTDCPQGRHCEPCGPAFARIDVC
jgi:hypothetical protein